MVLNDAMSLRGAVRRRSNLPVKKLHRVLTKYLKAMVLLTITDNASVFLNAVFAKGVWRVRLHRMFLKARPGLRRDLARYIDTHDKGSSKKIDQYIEGHWHWVKHRIPPIVTKGKVYDLEKLFKDLNRKFLKNGVKADITWGQKGIRRAYEELQMGSYSTSKNLITVHPHLDQRFVPLHVVEATVFHEMCHALVPVKKVNGRRQIHPPVFKKLEVLYPRLKEALEWEGKNLGRLMRRPKKRGKRA